MECSVCYSTFDSHEHRPRTLPCGHTFCTTCIEGVVDRTSSTARCPSCRAFSFATFAEQFPVSYIAEALMTQLEKMKMKRGAGAEGEQEFSESGGEEREVERRLLQKEKKFKAMKGAGDFARVNRLLQREKRARLAEAMADVIKMQCQLEHYQFEISEWKAQHHSYQEKLRHLMSHNSLSLDLLGQEDSRVTLMRMRGRKLLARMRMESRSEHTHTNKDSNHDEDDDTGCVDMKSNEAWTRECRMTFPDLETATYSLRVSTITIQSSFPFGGSLSKLCNTIPK